MISIRKFILDNQQKIFINLNNGFLPSASIEICDEIALVFPKVIAEGTIPLEKQEQDRAKIVDVERIKPITQVINLARGLK